MANHNDVLLAAAIAGITAGVNDGRDFSQINSTSLSASTATTAAILAAAKAVDQAIPFDALLSGGADDPTILITNLGAGGSQAGSMPFFAKPQCLAQLCKAAFKSKSDLGESAADTFAAIAAGIAAQYAASVAQQPLT